MVRFRLRLQLHEYELCAGLTVVGRAPSCNLTIEDALLSREHAALRLTDGRVTIRDLGSRNGTFVNGVQIHDDVELHDGDRVKVGTTEMVFTRVVHARRTVATTASVTQCAACGASYVAQAACCPHCGARKSVERIRTESQQRRDFWLSLEVELLDKALEMNRHDEALDCVLRLQTKLDEVVALRKTMDLNAVERALVAVVCFARVRGAGKTIGWVFDVMRKLTFLPGPELFALIAATPPIVLEEAASALSALIDANRIRALEPTAQSCLRSLTTLSDDLCAFGAMRSAETTPRAPVAAVA